MNETEQRVIDVLDEQSFKLTAKENGKLRYPFLQPGIPYKNTLWDWDSFFTIEGMSAVLKLKPNAEKKESLARAAMGNVLNFLDMQEDDGFIPCMVRSDVENDDYATRPRANNAHKPVLSRHALKAFELYDECGLPKNYLSNFPIEKLEKYLEYYYKNQFNEQSGLFVYADDVFLGADNNPTVFGRLPYSSADVFLNSLMVAELKAMTELAKIFNRDAKLWENKHDALKNAMNELMWDEKDCFYYSQDVNVKTHVTEYFNHGLPAFWKTMPLKIKMFSCYMPLCFGVADEKRAAAALDAFSESGLDCPYGVRTVSKFERAYNLEPSGNPSNWLGAVWTIANYFVFEAFLSYGRIEDARRIKEQTEAYLIKDLEKTGSLSESYHPDTGEKFLNNDFFSFNTLYACMVLKMRNL